MFISKRKHAQEVKELEEKIYELRTIIEANHKCYAKEKEEYIKKLDAKYRYNFPQKPDTIIVSEYVADKFLADKTHFTSRISLPAYEYEGLKIKVDERLGEYEVLFRATWEEPPVTCENCSKVNQYECSYPRHNPKFCNKECFDKFFS